MIINRLDILIRCSFFLCVCVSRPIYCMGVIETVRAMLYLSIDQLIFLLYGQS